MVKYYYDKYAAIENVSYIEPNWVYVGPATGGFANLFKDYTWDSINGKFSTIGDRHGWGVIVTQGTNGYSLYSDVLERRTVTEVDGYTQDDDLKTDLWQKKTADKIKDITYTRGSLVQSDIAVENGTYPTNGRHSDGYWYVRKSIVNQNPVITPTTVPSGSKAVKPSFDYTVSDPDGNAMTVTESIDGIIFNTRTSVLSGTKLTFTPTDIAWLRTRIKQSVNITITANDGNGGITTVNYPITRTTPAIDMQLKTPFETNVAAKRILVQLEGSIPVDAVVNVQVCNNAFDANPTWENATNLVLSKFPFPFTNKTKTAAKWGVSFKIRIERGSSAGTIYLDGVGGAYD